MARRAMLIDLSDPESIKKLPRVARIQVLKALAQTFAAKALAEAEDKDKEQEDASSESR